MGKWIDADALKECMRGKFIDSVEERIAIREIDSAPSIDIVFCENCRKSHIDGKSTHYLWCTEWGRSTDPFGYCERGGREGE